MYIKFIYQPILALSDKLKKVKNPPLEPLQVKLMESLNEFIVLFSEYRENIHGRILPHQLSAIENILNKIIISEPEPSDNTEEYEQRFNRFSRSIETKTEVVNFNKEYQKLLRMINFYNVRRSEIIQEKYHGISTCLGQSYSHLPPFLSSVNSLFFTLTAKGYQIYYHDKEKLAYFKTSLEDFKFHPSEMTIEADAPKVVDFEGYKQYITLPHTEIGKLLCLHYWTDDPRRKILVLYKNAKDVNNKPLNPTICRLLEQRSKVFQEADFDFYRGYWSKVKLTLLQDKGKLKDEESKQIVDQLLSAAKEDEYFNEGDHRRYLGPLLSLQQKYLSLNDKEKYELSGGILKRLHGLKSILIIGDTDELAGVSRRLSNYFGQVYEFDCLSAGSPFVLFRPEGCCFYFPSKEVMALVEIQLKAHDIKPIPSLSWPSDAKSQSFNDKPSSHKEEPSGLEYPFKLSISPKDNEKLLYLARFHPANINVALRQAYKNQDLDYTQLLLNSCQQSSTPNKGLSKISTEFAVAPLKDGRQLVRFKVSTPLATADAGMGQVIFCVDDSSSMDRNNKMQAANLACIKIIKQLPKGTKIIFRLFNGSRPFEDANKEDLDADWKLKIRNIRANGTTPLVQSIVEAASSIAPHNYFTPYEALKNSTIILLTDGEGGEAETAEEILQAVQDGIFRGRDISKKNHALGTSELPNKSQLPIIPIGIGRSYDKKVIDGLSNFAGHYHIPDDNSMDKHLEKMIASIKSTFGKKIGPIHLGLFNGNKAIVCSQIEIMLPGTSRYFYSLLAADTSIIHLESVINVESQTTCTNLSANQNVPRDEILISYYQAKLDEVVLTFSSQTARLQTSYAYASYESISREHHQALTIASLPSTTVFQPTALDRIKVNIKAKLLALETDIKDNLANTNESAPLLEQIADLQTFVDKFSPSNQDDLRLRQAAASGRIHGRGDDDDVNRQNSTSLSVVLN